MFLERKHDVHNIAVKFENSPYASVEILVGISQTTKDVTINGTIKKKMKGHAFEELDEVEIENVVSKLKFKVRRKKLHKCLGVLLL